MRQHSSRNLWWVLLGVIGISAVAWLVNTYPPGQTIHFIIFFLIIFFSSFFLSLFLLNNVRRALLVSLGIALFLLLRYLNLRESYYVVLLIASLGSLEIALRKR